MRTIAIVNQKGGSGKTTTAVNLGAALGEKSRREVARLTDHDGWVTALAFSPDGSTLAVGTQAGTLQRWSLAVLPTPGPELLKRAQRDFGLGLDGLKPIPLREAEKTAAVSAARGR